MTKRIPLPPHLYAVVTFTSRRIAGLFPSELVAKEFRDTHCSSASVYAARIDDDGRNVILGARL